MRGYFGIGIYHTKNVLNVGTLWRSAHNFGASFIFTVGMRYKIQASDTTKAWKTIPLYHLQTIEEALNFMPYDCPLVAVEQSDKSIPLQTFRHPERAVYLLGAEDHGIPLEVLSRCYKTVHIDTPMCINVAVAGSIVMYDRSVRR
jgi:tRNA G18 (ribose-2'-O)-methylase SpoU